MGKRPRTAEIRRGIVQQHVEKGKVQRKEDKK